MRIAVNTRLLIKNKLDGIGWFTYQTLRRLVLNHPEHHFIFLFDRAFDPEFVFNGNVEARVVYPPARHPFLWYTWFEWQLPRILREIKADVFLSPDGFLPLKCSLPMVPVIHDINFHHRPMDLPYWSRKYYRYFFPKFAAAAERIVTVSEYSKSDISTSYGIDPSKIDVVYNGSHELYKPLTVSRKEEVKKRYSGGADYFVFIGSLHPRKNVDSLLKAFEAFRNHHVSGIKLLIVGGRFFGNSEMGKTYSGMKFKSEVIFTGRKEPAELSEITGAALALTFVPHFEGFGIPVLEAMYCDVPAVVSDVTSIPEVAGDAALYVNPSDIHSIYTGLKRIAFDTDLRNALISECRIQRSKFSWDTTAAKLWDSLNAAFANQ